MGVYAGLHECVATKPPLVIFTSSLAAFALALLGISFYLESHKTTILDPDVKDWNGFYGVLSKLKVCIPNHSEPDKQSKLSVISPVTNALDVQANNTKNTNITKSVILDLHFTELKPKEFMGISFHGQILAKYLQHKRDMNLLDITITFPKPDKKGQPCVTFHGPSHLLPDAPKKASPEECLVQNGTKEKVQQVEIINVEMMAKDWCKDGKQTGIRISVNKSYNVYLTEGDVTLIQLHIHYTTCLLFFMMVMLGLYAICGRRCFVAKSKILSSSPDKVPLNP